MPRLMLLTVLIGVCAVESANASDWVKIGRTTQHHERKDLPWIEPRAHIDPYDENIDWSVDRASIHREGPYMKAWIEKLNTSNAPGSLGKGKRRELLEIDCDEQKYRLIEAIIYTAAGKFSADFVASGPPCGNVWENPTASNCWPNAWGDPTTWDNIVPDSIMEDVAHFICQHGKAN